MPANKRSLDDPGFKKDVMSDIQKEIRKESFKISTKPAQKVEISRISQKKPVLKDVGLIGVLVIVIALLLVFLPNFPFGTEGSDQRIESIMDPGEIIPTPDDSIITDLIPAPDISLKVTEHEFSSGLGCKFNPSLRTAVCDISTTYPNQFLDFTINIENTGNADGILRKDEFTFIDNRDREYGAVNENLSGYISIDDGFVGINDTEQYKIAFEVPQDVIQGTLQYNSEQLYIVRIPAPLGTIKLDNYRVHFGEKINATFIPAEEVDVYIKGNCTNPWKVFWKDAATEWIEEPNWYQKYGECENKCENNFISQGVCETCPAELQSNCIPLGENDQTNWDLKTYEKKSGLCAEQMGEYVFIEPAQKGQYKFEYEYYENSDCAYKRSAEIFFTIKDA